MKTTPFYNDRDRYYVQTNNPTEQILKKEGIKGWLESCGSVALTNCMGALGKDYVITCPGGFQPQIDELVTGYLNDPRNYTKFREARPNLNPDDPSSPPGNRIPQYFPLAAKEVFGVIGTFFTAIDDPDHIWARAVEQISAGHPVQLCLKNPGHYIAGVAYDEVKDEIVINDSWPGRFPDGDGFNKRLARLDASNLKNFMVSYR